MMTHKCFESVSFVITKWSISRLLYEYYTMTERYHDLACRVTATVYKGLVNRVETLSQVSCKTT
jgi:hypothetical protein